MSGERLTYLPLGGAGEIGMNCYVYGYGPPDQERLLVVDLGVTFGDMETTPGVDLILPDVSWLEARRDRIEAIVITHAHEDHVGAVGLLWERLRAPIIARRFTAAIARHKLDERGAPDPDPPLPSAHETRAAIAGTRTSTRRMARRHDIAFRTVTACRSPRRSERSHPPRTSCPRPRRSARSRGPP